MKIAISHCNAHSKLGITNRIRMFTSYSCTKTLASTKSKWLMRCRTNSFTGSYNSQTRPWKSLNILKNYPKTNTLIALSTACMVCMVFLSGSIIGYGCLFALTAAYVSQASVITSIWCKMKILQYAQRLSRRQHAHGFASKWLDHWLWLSVCFDGLRRSSKRNYRYNA